MLDLNKYDSQPEQVWKSLGTFFDLLPEESKAQLENYYQSLTRMSYALYYSLHQNILLRYLKYQKGWREVLYNQQDVIFSDTGEGTLTNVQKEYLPKPTGVTASGTSGSNVFSYKVSALNEYGETLSSNECILLDSQTPTSESNKITINWSSVTGATGYKIYGRVFKNPVLLATVGNVTSYDDIGESPEDEDILPPTVNTAVNSYLYTIPDNEYYLSIPTLNENDSATLVEGTDYELVGLRKIRFFASSVTPIADLRRNVTYGTYQWDSALALDPNLVNIYFEAFGKEAPLDLLINEYYLPHTLAYTNETSNLIKKQYWAEHLKYWAWAYSSKLRKKPTVSNIQDLLALANDYPFSYEAGTVTFTDSDYITVSGENGAWTYEIGSGNTALVNSGQAVDQFDILVDGAYLEDYTTNPVLIGGLASDDEEERLVIKLYSTASGFNADPEIYTNFKKQAIPAGLIVKEDVPEDYDYAPFTAVVETTSNNQTFTFDLFPDYQFSVNSTNHPNIPTGAFNLVDLIAATNATIDWGDGNVETITRPERQTQDNVSFTDTIQHQYTTAGEYTITISGDFPVINLESEPALKSVTQVGKTKLQFLRFYNCDSLTSFTAGGSNCDTSRIKSMHEMFYLCDNISTANLNGFDTSNVIDMQGMFSGAVRIENIDISTFDTSNVRTFDYMFYNMSFNAPDYVSGYKHDGDTILPYLDTSSATGFNSTFYFQRYTNFDVGNFDMSNVNTISQMFYGASEVENMHLWDVRNLSYGSQIVFPGTITTEQLSLIYVNWGAQTFVGDPSTRSNLNFGITKYNATPEALAGRQSLIDQGWDITDGGGIANDQIVVGAYNDDDSGAVYVYDATDLSASPVKLTPSGLDAGDNFGYSVAVTDSQIVIGVPNDDDYGTDSGAVYVFNPADLSATPTKLTPSGLGAGDLFGWSVAATSNQIIVGASGDDDQGNGAGAVYVYDVTDLSATPTKLAPSGLNLGDNFGWSVAATSSQIVVGASKDDAYGTDSGAAYVFNATDLSAAPTKLAPSELEAVDNFGHSVAVTSSQIVIGARGDDDVAFSGGAVYVYDATDLSATPTKLAPSGLSGGDNFGYSVAVTSSQIVIGAFRDDDQGADAGAVYVYDATDLSATPTKLAPSELGAGDLFGEKYAVAATSNQIIVGAPEDDDDGTNAGAVYVYDATDLSATPTKLTPSELGAGDLFGYSVAATQ